MCKLGDIIVVKEFKDKKGTNLEIKPEEIHGQNINSKGGYIRADELFYFNKNKIEYKVIAHMDDELLDELVQLIIKLHDKNKERSVITNL